MHLLTWHGTLVCRPEAAGVLRHYPIPLRPGITPCVVQDGLAAPGGEAAHPDLGVVQAMPGGRGGVLYFRRGEFFMCAEMPSTKIVFDRIAADGWERFLPLSSAGLADLRDILGHRWIVHGSRRIIRRREIALEDAFQFRIGPFGLDLTQLQVPLSLERDDAGRPLRLSFRHGASAVDLVVAEAGGSVLIRKTGSTAPARADAETLVIALHRHLTGLEPAQTVFDRLSAVLEDLGGVRGVEDFLEFLVPTAAQPEAAILGAADADRRQAIWQAMSGFAEARPSINADPLSTMHQAAILRAANESLRRFTSGLNLRRSFSFGLYDRAPLPDWVHGETVLVDVSARTVAFRVQDEITLHWTLFERCLPVIYLMEGVLDRGDVPNMRFFAEVGDAGYLEAVAYCSKSDNGCLVPDSDFFASGGYADTRNLIATRGTPWEARTPIIFWRGSTTGRRRHPPPEAGAADNFTWLPRLDLCRRARDSSLAAHYDVGISSVTQMEEPDLEQRIRRAGLCKAPVPREEFLDKKAIIVIDGNANAWSALFCALLSGACVLLVGSPENYRQWYYDRLAPWQHFVPVSEDLRDLDHVAKWVLAHDEDARAIGQAGRAVMEALTFDMAIEDAVGRLRAWLPRAMEKNFFL